MTELTGNLFQPNVCVLVLSEELLVGMLWVEIPLDHLHPLQPSCLFLVDARPAGFVRAVRLARESTELARGSVGMAVLRKVAQHHILFRFCQVHKVL